jgi:hypothetical protein
LSEKIFVPSSQGEVELIKLISEGGTEIKASKAEFDELVIEYNDSQIEFNSHLNASMPHQYTNGEGITYRWGVAEQDGVLGIIREVVE